MLIKTIGNLLVDLRAGTEAQHRRLEKHPLLLPLMTSTLSLEQYTQVIAGFTGFYESLESRIREMSARFEFPDYRYQARLPLLLEDCATLPSCAVIPCTVTPEYSCKDQLLGVLYVLEGATQGGLVIAPRLHASLALTANTGARYFNFYQHNSWQKFRAMVELCQQDCDHSLAVAAAQATFVSLYSHLDHCLSQFRRLM